jgi:hypothetical protein
MGGRLKLGLLVAALLALLVPMTASAAPPSTKQHARLLVTGLNGGFGSTVGADCPVRHRTAVAPEATQRSRL